MARSAPMVLLKRVGLYVMAALYALAGVMHFVDTEFFMRIMPPYLPWHLFFVYLSGVIEILLAIGLLIPRTRRLAAWGVIALLIAVFPANIYHFTSGGAGMDVPQWTLGVRLVLQFVLIAWAWVYTKEAD